MSSLNGRSSIPSASVASSTAPAAKRRAAVENAAKALPAARQQAKKRVALGDLTNRRTPTRPSGTKGVDKVKAASSNSTLEKGPVAFVRDSGFHQNPVVTPSDGKPTTITFKRDTLVPTNDGPSICLVACNTVISRSRSGNSVSLDETMSTSDSIISPDCEYIDNGDSSAVDSLRRQATDNLHIYDDADADAAGCAWKQDVPVAMKTNDSIVGVDNNQNDPQLCATLACDIYEHLRIAETTKKTSMDFMENVQKDINASMRAILIDWLVEVAEEYRLVPDMNRRRLQLLGVACMMIAAKYEEICAPHVEEFCYITDNSYFKDEVLQMEAAVLKYLRFEMTAPTAKCFLRRSVRVSHGCGEDPLLQLEFLANYVAELSLLEYDMLRYAPSLIAASSIFLARFVLRPTKQPWNATLAHYTLYKPSELCECSNALHRLFHNSSSSNLLAIRAKYSQHKFKFVAKKYCPPSIPSEFFQDTRD